MTCSEAIVSTYNSLAEHYAWPKSKSNVINTVSSVIKAIALSQDINSDVTSEDVLYQDAFGISSMMYAIQYNDADKLEIILTIDNTNINDLYSNSQVKFIYFMSNVCFNNTECEFIYAKNLIQPDSFNDIESIDFTNQINNINSKCVINAENSISCTSFLA